MNDLLDDIDQKKKKVGIRQQIVRFLPIFMLGGILSALASNFGATIEVETIIFTGPVVLLAGIVLIILFFVSRKILPLLLGFYLIVLPLFVFLQIFSNNLTPSQAEEQLIPFVTLVNYSICLFWIVLLVVFWRKLKLVK